MSYTAPTASDLKTRYPAFSGVADATVTYWLAEAAQDCALFPEALRARAEMAYAAHKLVEVGAIAGTIPQGLTQFKSGTFSATVASELASLTGFDATVYGREFTAMRRAAFSGPIMAWNPPEPDNA